MSFFFSLEYSRVLLVTRASLLGARTLLGAPGLTTRNKKLLATKKGIRVLPLHPSSDGDNKGNAFFGAAIELPSLFISWFFSLFSLCFFVVCSTSNMLTSGFFPSSSFSSLGHHYKEFL